MIRDEKTADLMFSVKIYIPLRFKCPTVFSGWCSVRFCLDPMFAKAQIYYYSTYTCFQRMRDCGAFTAVVMSIFIN